MAVLDDGGHMVAFQREDNSAIMRYEIAFGKAWRALGMGRSTRSLRAMAQDRPHFAESLTTASAGRFVPVLGGVLIRDADGAVMGAIGVTGDSEDNDETAAIAGIAAAGLVVDAE